MSRRHDRITAEFQDGWESACRLHRFLREGGGFQALADPPVALEPGEFCCAATELEYSRHYGIQVTVTYEETIRRGSLLHPLRSIGEALDREAGRRDFGRARREAERLRQPYWRDEQVVDVLLTNARVLCDADGGWWSFWYSQITEQVVELADWSFQLVMESGDPVRLRGPDAPSYALAVSYFTYGEESLSEPVFAPLAGTGTAPPV